MTLIMSEDRPQQIWDGIKFLTCRPRKEGDRFQHATDVLPAKVLDANMRTRWQVGGVYGIKPQRIAPVCLVDASGKVVTDLVAEYLDVFGYGFGDEDITLKGRRDTLLQEAHGYRLLQVRVQGIHPVDVRRMNHLEALAEGFSNVMEFWHVWCSLHDPAMIQRMADCEHAPWYPNHCPLFLGERPDDLYQAWMLRFQAVKS